MQRLPIVVVAAVVSAGSVVGCAADSDPGKAAPVADGAREIAVTADDFTFDPNEISVTTGEDVAIVLTASDLLHDLTVDELEIQLTAERGESTSSGLRAEQPGSYAFYCSVPGHRESGMEGTLIVEG